MEHKKRASALIGVADYTVILTFIGLLSAVFGMVQAMAGHFRIAICCLAFSGLCDAFDGRVARTKKDRTTAETLNGIQLDSLCDVICFGIFPIMICTLLGVRGIPGAIAVGIYAVCGVTRLAWFNVLETEELYSGIKGERVYHGLPITSISVILPLVFLLSFAVPESWMHIILTLTLLITGILFVVNFKMRKPRLRTILAMILVVGIAVVSILLFSRHRVIPLSQPGDDGPLIDAITEDEP